jgi:crotonobetainyl-CoA:carnitine CoA-transferase CaiB-like acyl-CoA transferase
VRLFNEAQVPAMAVRDFSDIMQDPHLQATNFFEKHTHPTEGSYYAMRPPVRFGAVPDLPMRDAPLLGEHTEQLRATLLGEHQ